MLTLKWFAGMERHQTLAALGKGHLPSSFTSKLGVLNSIANGLSDCLKGMLTRTTESRWSCDKVRACLEGLLEEFRQQPSQLGESMNTAR